MINLLPEQYKLRFSTEYRWRVAIVIMVFIDALIVIGMTLLVPVYLYSHAEATTTATQVEHTSQASNLHDGLVAQTATLSATLKALNDASLSTISFTKIMSIVSGDKTNADRITGINYTINAAPGKTTTITLVLQGTAATRNDLANFVATLKGESRITNVNIPISDYAADTDVPFNITITAS